MKPKYHIPLLMALILGSVSLNAQQNRQGNPHHTQENKDKGAYRGEANLQRGKADDRAAWNQDAPDREEKSEASWEAMRESQHLAETFGIDNPSKQRKLFDACEKYFEARALLHRQFPQRQGKAYTDREKQLQKEYSKELQGILPQY